MEPKTGIIVIIGVIAILLLLVIVYKIKNDKKVKSLASIYNAALKPIEKKSFLGTVPGALLAIIIAVVATIVLSGIGEGLGLLIKIKGGTGEAISYILYDIVIACCCYIIVKHNPGIIWYVPVICNIVGIISAIVEPNFWITPMWIPVCSGCVLSITVSITGVRIAKRRAISVNP